jgi:ankyrin repeat protein
MMKTTIDFSVLVKVVNTVTFVILAGLAFADDIHEAVQANDLSKLKKILEIRRVNLNSETSSGQTPLMLACRQGNLEICKTLIDAGADINYLDREKHPAIHYAVVEDNSGIVEYLIKNGAAINYRDGIGYNLTTYASIKGALQSLKLLHDSGDNLNNLDILGRSLLHHASYNNQEKIVKFLIENHCNVNSRAQFNVTPLHWAVERKLLNITKLLIENGADLECQRTENGHIMTPLMHACEIGDSATVKLLVTKGANLTSIDSNEFNCLHYASKNGQTEALKILLENKVNPNEVVKTSKYSPLHFAVDSGNFVAVKMLVDYGANIEYRNLEGNTPLSNAALGGKVEIANFLISKGANVNNKGVENSSWADNNAKTVLHFGIKSGNSQVVRLLLDSGANTFIRDGAGDDAYDFAIKVKQMSIAALISNLRKKSSNTGVKSESLTQKFKPSMPAVQTIFSDFSRVSSVDRSSAPVFRPSSLGRLLISARESKVTVFNTQVIEFAPTFDRADITLIEVTLFVDGREVRTQPVTSIQNLPHFSFETSNRDGDIQRVRLIGVDRLRKPIELLKADVKSKFINRSNGLKLGAYGDQIKIINAEAISEIADIFTPSGYLGRVASALEFAIDSRQLPPGSYSFWTVQSNKNGEVYPPLLSTLEIKPRFKLFSEFETSTFVVEGTRTSVPIDIKPHSGQQISSYQIFFDGAKIAENLISQQQVLISLLNVPTGKASFKVVGIGQDGSSFAAESIMIQIKNPFIDSLLVRDSRAKELQQMYKKMALYDQNVIYWYERAINEPEFHTYIFGKTFFAVDTFGRMASVGYIESLSVPGNAGKYLAECKAAVVRRSQFRLEIGQLQKKIGLLEAAKRTLEQVVFEVGSKSGIGLIAEQELRGL